MGEKQKTVTSFYFVSDLGVLYLKNENVANKHIKKLHKLCRFWY